MIHGKLPIARELVSIIVTHEFLSLFPQTGGELEVGGEGGVLSICLLSGGFFQGDSSSLAGMVSRGTMDTVHDD